MNEETVSVPDNTMAERLIQEFEGCSLKAYHGAADRPGVWTIGWGCTQIDGEPVTQNTPPITQTKADEMLAAEILPRAAAVDKHVVVSLTEAQRAALISFIYNEGIEVFLTSTLLRKLNAGDPYGAADELGKWIMSNGRRTNGLVNRRAKERAVFLGTVTV